MGKKSDLKCKVTHIDCVTLVLTLPKQSNKFYNR